MPFTHLFQPLTLRHKTLRHRLNFGAHTANMSEGGLPGAQHLAYYRERARGGAAMIVVEPVPAHATAVLTRGNFRADDDATIAPFRAITEAVKAEGAVIIQQIYHVGAHGDWDNSFEANWSPSGAPSFHDSAGSHRMSLRQIDEVIAGFVRNAVRAQRAGFDGIELMAAYNALIEQFWSPLTNRRDDAFGGTFTGRMRFSQTLLEAIRRAVGEDFIIGMAISIDETVPESLTGEAHAEIAAWHDARGLYDYVTIGTGSYFNFAALIPTFPFPDKLGAPLAEIIRGAVTHARVQAESHIRTPENADYVIASGQADMVSIVRGQIADPHMANKARDGHADRIRPCISCNQMCWGRRSRDYWISCLINPSAGREHLWGGDTSGAASEKKKVLIVGGGPAGLEAARVAAERGHAVILAEADSRLGGQFRLAGALPRRSQILDLLDWYERELRRLAVDIRLNTPLDAADVAQFDCDAVVLATGSLPTDTGYQRAMPGRDRLPGVAMANVWSVEAAMRREGQPGKAILLLDDTGGWRGAGSAWALAERGHQVTILTPDAFLGRELVRTAADGVARARLAVLGVTVITESALLAWHGDGATLRSLLTGNERRLSFDALVLATTNAANDEIALELAALDIAAETIGDAQAPRDAAAAIYEGRRLGLAL